MKKNIKLFDPVIGKEEGEEIEKILKSKFWASGAGTGNVKKFENKMKSFLQTNECVAVNSGTAALHLALSLIDIRKKEVILPSLSFVSTANAILYNEGIPVFADVNPQTLNIDTEDVKEKITKKTKAIIPVHFGGLPADMEEISLIAKKNNLEIIEDAAHSCGAKKNKKRIGSQSTCVCFSFHPVKNLAMPSGGLISINSKNAKKMKNKLNSLRWCGISNRTDSTYDVDNLGWNYYMNEFSASIGLIQLRKLDKLNKRRKEIAKQYFKKLKIKYKMPYDSNSVYHFYWILVKNQQNFRKKMFDAKIETGIHYPPIHKMSLYKKNKKLKNTERISKHIVTLPTHPNLSDNEINYIIKIINSEENDF